MSRLRMAVMRGQAAITVYVFARFVAPFALFAVALFYFFVIGVMADRPSGFRHMLAIAAGGIGLYVPNIYVSNIISRRQLSTPPKPRLA